MYTFIPKINQLQIPGITIKDLIDLAPHLHRVGSDIGLLFRYVEAFKGKHVIFEDFIEQAVLMFNNFENKHSCYFVSRLIYFYLRYEAYNLGCELNQLDDLEFDEKTNEIFELIMDDLYFNREDEYAMTYFGSQFSAYKLLKDKKIKLRMLKQLMSIYKYYTVNPEQYVVFVKPFLKKLKELEIKR
jgi:hypothetical protein